jgi:hypothetical protein
MVQQIVPRARRDSRAHPAKSPAQFARNFGTISWGKCNTQCSEQYRFFPEMDLTVVRLWSRFILLTLNQL